MNAKHFLLVLALLAPSLSYAQGAPQDKVQGRNSWLKERLAPLAGSVRSHVVKLSGGKSAGYGVVIKPGFVLTSDNLIGSSRSMRGTDSNGATHALTVHARQRKHGVAVLRFNEPEDSPRPIKLGASGSLAIGQIVAAIGTGEDCIAAGVVSALKRPVYPDGRAGGGGNVFLKMFSDGSNQGHTRAYPSVIQHDGPLEPEHFGSPLVNRKGELVGINVAYPYRGSAHAVGVDTFGKALSDLLAGKSTDAPPVKRPKRPRTEQPASGPRPYLGAGVAGATPQQLGKGHAYGLYVREVKKGGPAAKAGLTAGDVIVALDGQPFASMDVFAKRMRAKSPGDTMKLKVLKGAAGIETEVTVVLGKR